MGLSEKNVVYPGMMIMMMMMMRMMILTQLFNLPMKFKGTPYLDKPIYITINTYTYILIYIMSSNAVQTL